MGHRPTPHRTQAHATPRLEPTRTAPRGDCATSLPVVLSHASVQPGTGRTWWLLLPTVSIAAFVVALAEFAQAIGAGRGKQILLVLDHEGWHVSPQVQAPAGIHLHFLPPYSPELQPAERLWPLTNEALANRHFRDLEEL